MKISLKSISTYVFSSSSVKLTRVTNCFFPVNYHRKHKVSMMKSRKIPHLMPSNHLEDTDITNKVRNATIPALRHKRNIYPRRNHCEFFAFSLLFRYDPFTTPVPLIAHSAHSVNRAGQKTTGHADPLSFASLTSPVLICEGIKRTARRIYVAPTTITDP